MDRNISLEHPLPEVVSDVVWRIVGNIASPLKRETPRRLIEKTIRKYAEDLPLVVQDQAIAEVTEWFDFHQDKGWLKEEVQEAVGHLIVDGIKEALASRRRIENRETAFCAIGSIEPDLMMKLIGECWSSEELTVFVDYAFSTLEVLCNKDAVIDPSRARAMHLGIDNARASLTGARRGKRLERLSRLRNSDWWLYASVANMVELLVKLNPDHFYAIVDSIDNPLIHLRAARCVSDLSDVDVPLQWLDGKSSDSMVALAIAHVLESVRDLDADLRWRSRRNGEQEDIDPKASRLLSNLIDRIEGLGPIARAQWICELLDYGIFALNAQSGGKKPPRVEQLEELCRLQLIHLVKQSWSEELSTALRFGLCFNPLTPRILPLAQVALEIREEQPARSAEIAQLILETHEQQIADTFRQRDGFYYHLESWTNQDWVYGLGITLVLSDGRIDLPEWVRNKCQELPLSAWDAEEDYQRFMNADNLAQFRFLVALYAVQLFTDVGRLNDPVAVLTLAEDLWSHCRFIGRYITWELTGPSVADFAARVAIALGEPSDEWLLKQAGNTGVGPSTLWAMLDQEMPDGSRRIAFQDDREAPIVVELRRIASSRFGNAKGLDPTELFSLGKLWLLLEADQEAEETAMAIVSFPERKLNRMHKIIALKLLAFASSKRSLAPESDNRMALLYSQIWNSHSTLPEERDERQQIDDLLKAVQNRRSYRFLETMCLGLSIIPTFCIIPVHQVT